MKGFTLVELLGVVIILGILSVVATPTVENIVINSREKAYETQIKDIEKASSDYLLLYPDMAPSNNKVTIYLNTLKKLGLVDKNIKNPKTGKLFSNITSITISKENNMYVYDIKDSDLLDTELNENTPILSIDGEVVDYVEVSQVDKYNIPSCNAVNPSGVEGNVNCTYQIL
ncbi:MAG: prepilin-type N-terminal cleavage/methylation domain-containing protein, partial [Bacilli bacterium]|nr:prepilin-type N-terminal cleavage/methylation domain-containing protein [Bacilli bacterium]